MVSPAAAASVSSVVRTAPWVARSSMSGWPARGSLWIFARRYQEERCQNRFASASAWPCVTSRPSFVACQGAAAASSGNSAARWARLNASVTGQTALDPKPSASRWYGVSASALPEPE